MASDEIEEEDEQAEEKGDMSTPRKAGRKRRLSVEKPTREKKGRGGKGAAASGSCCNVLCY